MGSEEMEGPSLKKGIGKNQIFWLAGAVFENGFLIWPAYEFHYDGTGFCKRGSGGAGRRRLPG